MVPAQVAQASRRDLRAGRVLGTLHRSSGQSRSTCSVQNKTDATDCSAIRPAYHTSGTSAHDKIRKEHRKSKALCAFGSWRDDLRKVAKSTKWLGEKPAITGD